MTKGTEKIILYPREYNKRGESSLHSVLGATQAGELVNIKLRISEEFNHLKNPPSIQEFSRTDRKAKNPAIASPDNSPDNPEGVILFTGAFFEKEDKQKGIKSYIASWAHVLREDSDSGEPHFGIGRIKVKKDNTIMHRNIKKKLSSNITEEERKSLISKLEDPKSFDYSLILYLPDYQLALDKESDYASIYHEHSTLFNDYYSKGVSFGYYRIICDHNMNPIPNKSKEFLSRYSSITGDIDSPNEFLEKFTPHVKNEINQNGGVILIPCYRLNPTSNGKNYYSYPDRLSMIDAVFKNEEGYARANMLAVKTVNLGGRGIIFDRAHPLDYQKLNLDLLDCHGKETRLYSSNMTLSHNNSKLHSIRIGLIEHNAFLRFSQYPPVDPPVTPADQVMTPENEIMSLDGSATKSGENIQRPGEVEDVNRDQVLEERKLDEGDIISRDSLAKPNPLSKSLSDSEWESASDIDETNKDAPEQDDDQIDSRQEVGEDMAQKADDSDQGGEEQESLSSKSDSDHPDDQPSGNHISAPPQEIEEASIETKKAPSVLPDEKQDVSVDIYEDPLSSHEDKEASSEASDFPIHQKEVKDEAEDRMSKTAPTGMAAFLKRKR